MSKTNKIILGILAVLIIIFFVVRGTSMNKKSTDGEVIKIGAVLSFSGPASADGEAIKQGIDMAVEDLKAKGTNIEVIYQDDQTDPKNTVSALNMLDTQNVQAIIGPTWSFLGDAAVPVIDRMAKVAIMPANTSEFVQGDSNYVFYGSTKNLLKQESLERFIKENNIKKIAHIGGKDGWTSSIITPLEMAVKNTGASIVIDERLGFGSEVSAMPTIISKIKNEGADMILFSIFDDQGIKKLITDSRNQGINSPILASDSSLIRMVSQNIISPEYQNNLYHFRVISDSGFSEKFEKRYGKTPALYTDRGYDSLMILVEGIKNKGEMSLEQYLRTKTNYKGYAAQYRFDENGDVVGGDWVIEKVK